MVCDSREMANNWLGHHGCCQLLAAICVEVVISFCGHLFGGETYYMSSSDCDGSNVG